MSTVQDYKNISLMPALINCNCPRCRVGKVYEKGPYKFSNNKIQKSCSHCGLIYEKEPGYFYAAMYVGYAFVVAELVTAAVAISVLTGSTNPWLYISVMISFVLALSPFNYRYSRMLLLYFLTPGLRYHPEMS
ncbi:MAG TPA: DUF983 domain-containing protein [Mucilaginibacter sp.]|nr:DUF983 domain-containing protein [Mucilaginibacter sp.]